MKKTAKPEFFGVDLALKKLFSTVLICSSLVSPVLLLGGNNNNQNANDRRLARQVENTEKLQERFQAKMQEADSLIAVGDTLIARTSEEIRQATNHMRERLRTYTAERKDLEKKLNAASREEVSQMRIAIRDLDSQYRDDLKAYDDLMRRAIRESEAGSISYARGREYRKEAEKGLREAERQLVRLRESAAGREAEDDVASK